MYIYPYSSTNPLILAPMAGITDRPFRQLCRHWGAGLAVSEMVSANSLLWGSEKTKRRLNHDGETEPHWVQIVGADPKLMAEAARYNWEHGAQIIDINMGCPAKKICNVFAGSALLKNEPLVAKILTQVVHAVPIPVTLKMRTGWDKNQRNGVRIAKLAEQAGIQALTVHGRTRACGFSGTVDYATIAEIKAAVKIPVIANGDIRDPEKAKYVLEFTGADAIMIGRAAQGKPWLFKEIEHFLTYGEKLPALATEAIWPVVEQHLLNLYQFYGDFIGVRVARKHLSWYSKGFMNSTIFRNKINQLENSSAQLATARTFFLQDEIF